jgi:hypothetical protein
MRKLDWCGKKKTPDLQYVIWGLKNTKLTKPQIVQDIFNCFTIPQNQRKSEINIIKFGRGRKLFDIVKRVIILYPEFLALLAKYLCQRLTVLQESCKMAKFLIIQ